MQLASTRIITTDPFSYAAGGESWRTQSWLVELFYGFFESTFGGLEWVPILVAVVSVSTLSITGLTIYSASRSMVVTGAWLVVATWILAPFSQPRPVLFSYLLLAALVTILTVGDRLWWAVIPVIWLWAAVHGTWIIGVGLLVLTAIRRRSARLGVLAAIALATTALTAHGLGAWYFLTTFVENAGALEYLNEWQPPDFGNLVQMPYLLIVAGVVVAAAKGRIDMATLWVALPFLVFGLTSSRAVPIATLVLVPIAARAVTIRLPKSHASRSTVPVVVLLATVGIVVALHAMSRVTLDPERFPSDAAIDAAGDQPFFHDDGVGGYLIYGSGPDRQIYIDDRAELYGEEGFAELVAAKQGVYEELFDRLGMRSAIVREKWPLYAILLRDGWTIRYADEEFTVLTAPRL